MASAGLLTGVRVLIAHGDRATRTAMRALLTSVGAEVGEAAGTGAALQRVLRDRPHVLLLDDALSRRDERDVLREITGDPDGLGTAVIVMLPDAGLEEITRLLESGAVDVWSQPGADASIVARVRAAHRSRMLLDFALRRHSDLEDLAYRDELTGLPNRRGALRRLEVLVSRARRHGHPLALLVLDADHFKRINDDHGHAAGDDVLRELAARLGERVRGEDLVGRWGGEEVVLCLPDTELEGALALAEQLRRSVAERPFDAAGAGVALTISIGVATWEGEDLGVLVDRADRALYEAKAAGRDRVVAAEARARVRPGRLRTRAPQG